MNGKNRDAATRRHGDTAKRKNISAFAASPCLRVSASRGFTLLELMIVMFILVILASVALPQYRKIMLHARETVLRDDLFQMRKAIDQFTADKGALPQSPDDLAGKYLREIPVDPITNEKDWNWIRGEDPYATEGGQGIIDVHSSSTEQSSESTPYSEW